MLSSGLVFKLATEEDLDAILVIARHYIDDFSAYLDPLPAMVGNKRVFVMKRENMLLGFAAYGVSDKDYCECFTSSARAPGVTRQELSGDWMRARLEEVLIKRGFRKFTAHVRQDNRNAIKMLLRNGYERVERSDVMEYGLLEYSKRV